MKIEKHYKIKLICFAILFFIFLHQTFFSQQNFNQNHIATLNGTTHEFFAEIIEDPDKRIDKVHYTLSALSPYVGRIRITTKLYPEYSFGDHLKITCHLKTPEPIEGFSYDRYLARYDIYSLCFYPNIQFQSHEGNTVKKNILLLKQSIQTLINKSLSEPHASLLSAITIGNRRSIPQDVFDDFRSIGIVHIIAISGLHIMIFVLMLQNIAPHFYVSKNSAFFGITLFLVFYLILIGFPASAVRASIMAWLSLFAYSIGRQNVSLHSLIIVGTIMVLINPKILLSDIGFQLSFAAMSGIILFFPIFSALFNRFPNTLGAKDIILMTMSAQITTLPLVVYYFKSLPLISLLANIVISPLVFFIIFLSVIIFPLGFLFGGLSWIIFSPLWFLFSYIIFIARALSTIPFASIEVRSFSLFHVLAFYIAITFFYNTLKNYVHHKQKNI